MRHSGARLLALAFSATLALGVGVPEAVAAPSAPPTSTDTGAPSASPSPLEARHPLDATRSNKGANQTVSPSSPSPAPKQKPSPHPTPTPKSTPTPAPRLPYTGSTPLPESLGRKGAPFTTRSLATLRFGERKLVGWQWPGAGALMLGDMTGDSHPDVMLYTLRDGSVRIKLYQGHPGGGLSGLGEIGQGWNQFDYVTAGDVNGDGLADLIGRKRNGELWLYTATKSHHLNVGIKIGWGWSVMRSFTYVPSVRGKMPSLMATDHAGRLYNYPFANHSGAFGAKTAFAYGWNAVTRIMPLGDWDGNGSPDFYATDTDGYLYIYLADPSGRSYTSYKIGQGWTVMGQIMALPYNLGGGLYGIDRAGKLFYYPIIHKIITPPRPWSPWLQPVSSITRPTWTVTPRLGWNGTKVRVVRLALGQGAPLTSAMTFDRGTERAVLRFQRRAGLPLTGSVGPDTWSRLTDRPWTMDNFQMWPLVGVGASRAQRVETFISAAERFIGSPYTWGGSGPYWDGSDCAGTVLQSLYAAGIDPQPISVVDNAGPTYRTSQQLYAYPKMRHLAFWNRQRGDLIFWEGRYGIYHVAIYLGDDRVMESNFGYARERSLYNWDRITWDVVRPIPQ